MKTRHGMLATLLFAGATLCSTQAAAGHHGGPTTTKSTVQDGMTDVYKIWFDGNEYAHILASGDGDSDLDLYVFDEDGNFICKDDDDTDLMECVWVPNRTGMFIVEIKNRGQCLHRADQLIDRTLARIVRRPDGRHPTLRLYRCRYATTLKIATEY